MIVLISLLFGFMLLAQWREYSQQQRIFKAQLKRYAEAGGKPYCGKYMIGYKNPIIKRDYKGIFGKIQWVVDSIMFQPDETIYPKNEAEWEQQQAINKQARITAGLE